MERFYFKTVCEDGITRTESICSYNFRIAKKEAIELFSKFFKHGFVISMSKNDYFQFNKLTL